MLLIRINSLGVATMSHSTKLHSVLFIFLFAGVRSHLPYMLSHSLRPRLRVTITAHEGLPKFRRWRLHQRGGSYMKPCGKMGFGIGR